MFSNWPEWLSKSPYVRRRVMKIWRVLLRMQRASLAYGMLVVRGKDDRVLLLASASGELQLPVKELDGWLPIATQIEEWLGKLLPHASKPCLVSIDGSPGREGVCFIYTAKFEDDTRRGSELWLEPNAAASALNRREGQLLLRCINIPLAAV
jgi:hypothetical protein